MAGPTVSNKLWNAVSLVLTITPSATITSAANAAGDFQLTDAAGLLWSGPAAGTTYDTTSNTVTLARDLVRTPGTASTLDIAAGAITSAGGANLAITDASFNLAIDHTFSAQAITRNDLNALWTALDTSFTTGNFTDYDALQLADIRSLFNRLLKTPAGANQGHLLRTPRTEQMAYALIDQIEKFRQSSKTLEDMNLVIQAAKAMLSGLNARGTLAATSAGL